MLSQEIFLANATHNFFFLKKGKSEPTLPWRIELEVDDYTHLAHHWHCPLSYKSIHSGWKRLFNMYKVKIIYHIHLSSKVQGQILNIHKIECRFVNHIFHTLCNGIFPLQLKCSIKFLHNKYIFNLCANTMLTRGYFEKG